MQQLLLDTLNSYALLLPFSVFVFVVGHLIVCHTNELGRSYEQRLFIRLIVGLLTLVTAYAVFRTSGVTVFLGVIVSGLYYLLIRRDLLTTLSWYKIKDVTIMPIVAFAISLLVVVVMNAFLFHFDSRLFVHQDLAFYARLSSHLFQTGVEIANAEPFVLGSYAYRPYHFFNEWLVAMFMHFSDRTSLTILLLVATPLMTTIGLMGAVALAQKFYPNWKTGQLTYVSFLFLLIPGLLSFAIYFLTHLNGNAPYSIFQSGIVMLKVHIVTLLLMWFFLSNDGEITVHNMFPLSLIPLLWPTLIPAFLGGYFLYLIATYLNANFQIRYTLGQWLIPLVYLPVYLFTANRYATSRDITSELDDTYGLWNYLVETYSASSTLGEALLYVVIPFIGIFLLMMVMIKRKTRLVGSLNNKHLLLIFIVLASLLSYGLLQHLFNARQIVSNLIYPIMAILVFKTILRLFRCNARALLITTSGIYIITLSIAIWLMPGIKMNHLAQASLFSDTEQVDVPWLVASDLIPNNDLFFAYSKPFAHLLMYEEHFKPIKLNYFPITQPETPKSKYQSGINSETFYKYVRDRQMFDRIDEAKYQFLKEFRVRYMLVTDDRLTETDTYLIRLNIDQVKPFAENVSLLSLKWGD